jgi:hypothetical protein
VCQPYNEAWIRRWAAVVVVAAEGSDEEDQADLSYDSSIYDDNMAAPRAVGDDERDLWS